MTLQEWNDFSIKFKSGTIRIQSIYANSTLITDTSLATFYITKDSLLISRKRTLFPDEVIPYSINRRKITKITYTSTNSVCENVKRLKEWIFDTFDEFLIPNNINFMPGLSRSIKKDKPVKINLMKTYFLSTETPDTSAYIYGVNENICSNECITMLCVIWCWENGIKYKLK